MASGGLTIETPRRGLGHAVGGAMNQVVARFNDGRVLKGFTTDFVPTKDSFHMALAEGGVSARPVEVRTKELKALFFVRNLAGNPAYHERNSFEGTRPLAGRRLKVAFKDGEVLLGTTQGYQPGRPGFFVTPADGLSNNERCYVVTLAIESIAFI